MRKSLVGAVAVLSLVGVRPVASQQVEWGLNGGYTRSKTNVWLLRDGVVAGGDVQLLLGRVVTIGAEGSFEGLDGGRRFNPKDICSLGKPVPGQDMASIGTDCSTDLHVFGNRNSSLGLTLRLRMLSGSMAPYLLVGAGAVRERWCMNLAVHYPTTRPARREILPGEYEDWAIEQCVRETKAQFPLGAGVVYDTGLPFAISLEVRTTAFTRLGETPVWHPSYRLGVRLR